MLTGALPFTATDPMEWVHCHLARRPVPPNERLKTVPAPASQIIMKLLAKTAEERYQTAAGVERDLQQCLADWERQRRIDDFPLGQRAADPGEAVWESARGRDLACCLRAHRQGGKPELVLVSGYSGIGKSSVVNELHKMLVPPRGLFASGKFDQNKRDIPYSTLAQAFQSDLAPRASEGAAPECTAPDRPNPELTFIIGDQPPVAELEPQQAQRRFQLVFRRFIGVFARPEHPLALFLDDLQWLDAATLDVLEDLLTRSDLQHLMRIGAYRDNEVVAFRR
jgi:serine/threonine protein kinase